MDSEADRLSDLAMSIEDRQPEVSALLLSEIERSKIHRPGKLPAGIVTMLSTVEFVDEGSDIRRTLKLVFPPD
ncbi:MAG: transcription elongation factor GreAB, partial [Hyphomicrobiales bacterium]